MFRVLVIVGFLIYLITGLILIKNHAKLGISRPFKLLLLLIFILILVLLIYALLFLIMFGYNS